MLHFLRPMDSVVLALSISGCSVAVFADDGEESVCCTGRCAQLEAERAGNVSRKLRVQLALPRLSCAAAPVPPAGIPAAFAILKGWLLCSLLWMNIDTTGTTLLVKDVSTYVQLVRDPV